MATKELEKAATPPPAPQPGLPGLTVEDIQTALGAKEILIVQLTKLITTLREQNAALLRALAPAGAKPAKKKVDV